MKRTGALMDRILGPSALVRVLFFVFLGLAAAIVSGSLLAVALGLPAKRAARDGYGTAAWQRAGSAEADGLEDFSAIGALRVKSADSKPALLSVTVVLGIPSGDGAFREELISKTRDLKAACAAVFGSRKAAELSPSFEGALKARLRDVLNARLSLGKIEEVYFPIYQLIE